MPVTMHFKRQKVTVLAFENEEDLFQTCKSLDTIYNKGTNWPRYYMIQDPSTTEADSWEVRNFFEEMARMKADLETIKHNFDKGRFKEIM